MRKIIFTAVAAVAFALAAIAAPTVMHANAQTEGKPSYLCLARVAAPGCVSLDIYVSNASGLPLDGGFFALFYDGDKLDLCSDTSQPVAVRDDNALGASALATIAAPPSPLGNVGIEWVCQAPTITGDELLATVSFRVKSGKLEDFTSMAVGLCRDDNFIARFPTGESGEGSWFMLGGVKKTVAGGGAGVIFDLSAASGEVFSSDDAEKALSAPADSLEDELGTLAMDGLIIAAEEVEYAAVGAEAAVMLGAMEPGKFSPAVDPVFWLVVLCFAGVMAMAASCSVSLISHSRGSRAARPSPAGNNHNNHYNYHHGKDEPPAPPEIIDNNYSFGKFFEVTSLDDPLWDHRIKT